MLRILTAFITLSSLLFCSYNLHYPVLPNGHVIAGFHTHITLFSYYCLYSRVFGSPTVLLSYEKYVIYLSLIQINSIAVAS